MPPWRKSAPDYLKAYLTLEPRAAIDLGFEDWPKPT